MDVGNLKNNTFFMKGTKGNLKLFYQQPKTRIVIFTCGKVILMIFLQIHLSMDLVGKDSQGIFTKWKVSLIVILLQQKLTLKKILKIC